jgi:succinate dehydrogenase/fumarate reductase flavoprotein subunit
MCEPYTQFEADVLVIGGGMAGFYAALSAAGKEQKVLMVDKGTVGKSGFTPWANTFSVFDESLGDLREDWLRGVQVKGEYLVNLDYFHMQIEDSLARYNELVKWGIIDSRDDWDRNIAQSAREYLDGHDRRVIMPQILKDRGIDMVQRVMITDLLVHDNRVVGAMGFPMDSDGIMVFRAKATVMCSGSGAYKAPGYPIHCATFDGDAMAYRIGARIAGKEFMDFHFTGDIRPWDIWSMWAEVFVNRIYGTKGPSIDGIRIGIGPIFKVHTEGPPLPSFLPEFFGPMPLSPETTINMPISDPRGIGKSLFPRPQVGNMVMGAATGLGVHKSEGIWPVDEKCFSGIPGLYAAGDALASMICGASYPAIGTSLSGSAVQGYRAGLHAAEYAGQVDEPHVSKDEVACIEERILAPRKRRQGFDPRWVSQVLLSIMQPYYILLVMDKPRLEGALKNVEFLQDELVPRLRASDSHELRLAHETQNMVLNAEMKSRACLLRTESRGNHYRQDYPARNDTDWLAWILIKQGSNGKMSLIKKLVPDGWKGDLSAPYKERYPHRFPGELEFMGLT